MASDARDWIGVASCCQGPRPAATFADLPRKHQWEMLRFALAATLSIAYFVGAGILVRPLPSRSLAAQVFLPEASVARVASPEMGSVSSINAPSPRPLVERAVRPSAALPLALPREPLVDVSQAVQVTPRPERRRNIVSRLLRSAFRGASAVAFKADGA